MVIFFFLIMCGGPLLPTWMFLNSMQLIFHVPLIKSDMPAHTHFFMIEYLSVLRLHFDWTESASESVLGSADKDDYDAMSNSQNEFYSSQIKEAGYHYSFVSNLFVMICLAAIIFMIWLLVVLKDICFVKCCRKRESKRNEPFWTNF